MLYILGKKNLRSTMEKNWIFAECQKNALGKINFAECQKKHSVKISFCWVPDDRHSANTNGHQSVWRLAPAAATCSNFAGCLPRGSQQMYFMPRAGLLPSAGTRQKWNVPCAEALPSAWGSALGKEVVCRVPVVWHSAKHRALGIYVVSGSAQTHVRKYPRKSFKDVVILFKNKSICCSLVATHSCSVN